MKRLLLVVGFACALGVGCGDQGQAPSRDVAGQKPSASAVAKRPVDSSLVAFLSKARAAHHSADLAEAKGDIPLAIKHVGAIPYGPRPSPGPEVEEVIADAHARLADLKSRLEQFDEALREVERGLELAVGTTHYRGHLFEVRGLVHERRMKSFEAKGDQKAAEEAKKAALEAFDQAIEIQDQVIKKALPDASSAPSAPPAPSPSP